MVAGLAGRAIELRVLQYGVTRDRLRDALLDGEGWDVIHFSGHGQPGAVLLERPDGKPDPINSEEVAELITEAGQRLKLVTLSACLSAASSIQQTMSWLGIAPASRDAGANPEAADAAKQSHKPRQRSLARWSASSIARSGDALRGRGRVCDDVRPQPL